MWVIGNGYLYRELKKLNIKDVFFYGYIKNELKFEMLGKAHIILIPAVREGWGLVVTESNAMGTPAVAYNVPGLRDLSDMEKLGYWSKRTRHTSLQPPQFGC